MEVRHPDRAAVADAASGAQEGLLRRQLRRVLRRPPAVALSLAGTLTVAVLLAQAVQGRVPFSGLGDTGAFLSILVHIPLAAYLPGAYLAVLNGAATRLAELRLPASARAGDAGVARGMPPGARPSSGWVGAAVLGLGLGLIGPYLTEPTVDTPLGFWAPSRWSPEVAWHRALGLWAGGALGVFSYAVLGTSRAFSRAAAGIDSVDLFDLAPYRPFVQQGLSNGLMAAGMLSLISLFALNQGLSPMLVLLGVGSVLLVAVAAALPVIGIGRRIHAARAVELAWCDAALRAERSAVKEGRSVGRLADLIAYRGQVAGVRAWPVDSNGTRRLVLYLLIPLGSWIGSGLVQHVVDLLLDR